ncbi:ribonuclease g [Lasius niger]|uniref:Ribonuclease G n=1 Tax=Lasius niger TaxID=67767 RepID=A0A0J7MXF4_LASNI|nr:ribonuclease g [Lasius niger]
MITIKAKTVRQWLDFPEVRILIMAALAWLLSVILHKLMGRIVRRMSRRYPLLSDLLLRAKGPMLWIVPLLLFSLMLLGLPSRSAPEWLPGLERGLLMSLIAAGTWLLVRWIGALENAAVRLHPFDVKDNGYNRKILTQVRVLSRTGMVVVVVVGVAGIMMSIPQVRQFGASLMASAGLAGLALGFAARPVLSNIIAGLQIALTQPISLDDTVMIEGELGYIEEITATYVVMRIWDERRLVVPLNYFIEHPIRNWTRTDPSLISAVFMWFDYRMPLDPLREELLRICRNTPEWDGKTCILQIAETCEHAMKIRILVSAVGMPAWWDLGCRVREGLVDFVNRNYPDCLPLMRAWAYVDGEQSGTVSEEILINLTPRETRVAVVESGMLQELHVERASRRGYVGNIYKGRVQRVMPGMQAAFVDIGLERAAFLHASDIARPLLSGGEPALPASSAINELIHEGQEIVVQVVKDPIGSKAARLSSHLSISSRYLVLLPQSQTLGISAKIDEEDERRRLRDILSPWLGELPLGYIVRTNAEDQSEEALTFDITYLGKVWRVVQENIVKAKVGERVYEELALPLRSLRDLLHAGIEKVRVDSPETHQQVVKFVNKFMPGLTDRVEYYDGEQSIFDLYGVEDEIQRALRREVPLKSGGHLVIDQTEAMTTIDVNTGGYVGSRNLEETVYRTNLEAAQAAARQLRLRNLGGIIIIDFIDMNDEEHKRQVLRMLEKGLTRDYAKTTVYPMSSLGLVEMTRKRTTESLENQLCEPCPACGGRGTQKTAETVSYEIFREITRAARQFNAQQLLVLANSKVVGRILEEESVVVAELEESISKSIRFQAEEFYPQEQFDVVLL